MREVQQRSAAGEGTKPYTFVAPVDTRSYRIGTRERAYRHKVDQSEMVHARFLAPLVKARGFGMTLVEKTDGVRLRIIFCREAIMKYEFNC